MRKLRMLLPVVLSGALLACDPPQPPRVLVYSHTAGFRHSSIEAAKAALLRVADSSRFVIDTTENPSLITEDSLRQYAAVVFLHTTGDILDRSAEVDLQRFIQAGGGFVGIHAAADAEYDWRWYGRMVGGYFANHPAIQPADLRVVDNTQPSTAHLPQTWRRTDEWYNFRRMTDSLHVLLSIDEASYSGGTNGANHPMSWQHEFDGGRAWYTGLGHTEESWTDSLFLRHVVEGINYAIGDRKPLDYARVTTPRVPADSTLVRRVLSLGTLEEPTELAVLPNGDVLIAQRRGQLALFKRADSAMRVAASFDVYSTSGVRNVNAEEGLLGIALDPAFAQNSFVYVFYSPADTSVNRLSRFVFDGDSLELSSEKVILQFYSQRRICCHTGGSLAFGADNILFISTGDNSTPFDEPGERYPSHGFAPLDDRRGHEQYDARRTSGNTNDLRGKILRIRIRADGSYEIPPGNLFPSGTPQTRPEIYVMGNRNPYRISVDAKRGFLYWGEVGPDAANDSINVRGPRGYDEINQARQAGNFGWPMFIGDNYAYRNWNYATGTTGAPFDPAAPLNASRNNTGARSLPPAQPAFIWYPYGPSTDFPKAGEGGRTAMAGPVYYRDRIPSPHANALPAYYDGKLFIYDWIRHWIMAVTVTPNGDYEAMERLMPNETFAAPIDMDVGPDGRIYVLEYGKGWFAKNPDAALSVIEYRAK